MRIVSLCLILGVSNCVHHTSSEVRSRWHALKKRTDLVCYTWPTRKDDLSLEEVLPLEPSGTHAIVKVVNRRGTRGAYFSPFDPGQGPDQEGFRPLNLGGDAFLAGGLEVDSRFYGVVFSDKNGASHLELLDLTENVVSGRTPLKGIMVEEATLFANGRGAWIVFKDGNGAFRVGHLSLQNVAAPLMTLFDPLFEESPQVLPQLDEKGVPHASIVWKDASGSLKGAQFGVDSRGAPRVGKTVPIDLGSLSEIEQWTAYSEKNDRSFLVLLEGDSLVGDVFLKVFRLRWSPAGIAIDAQGSQRIQDVHLSKPQVVRALRGFEVILLKWVDEESTLARYKLGSKTLGNPSLNGIFPKGSSILKYGYRRSSKAEWALIRHREDSTWVFQVCQL